MTELIDDLLSLSRVTVSVTRREKVDLREIAYEVRAICGETIRREK